MALSSASAPRSTGRLRRLVAMTAATLVAAPLLAAAPTSASAATPDQICASMDDPIYLVLDPSRERTLLTPWATEVSSAAKHGFTDNRGVAMHASTTPAEGLLPVYRLYNATTGSHLWTMSESERKSAAGAGFTSEKIDFYASPTKLSCTDDVVRFTSDRNGERRYALTADAAQRDYFGTSWGNSATNFFAAPSEAGSSAKRTTSTARTPGQAPAPAPAPATAPASAGNAGSVAVGQARYSVPSNALFVAPGGNDSAAGSSGAPLQSLEAAVSRVRDGQTIVLRGGVYNSQIKFFTNNVTIQNYPGETVWLDGTLPVSGFSRQGDGTYQARWTYEFDSSPSHTRGQAGSGWFAFVGENNKMAAFPDQVFLGGTPLRQVEGKPGRGEFARNYGNDRIILGEDPAGREVRASSKENAMFLGGQNVTVQGIGIRRYATGLAALGTVYSMQGGLTMRNVVIEDAATTALNLGHLGRGGPSTIENVTITRAGMNAVGFNGADGSRLRNSVLQDANWEGFNMAPGAAGIKVVRQQNVTIENNVIKGTGSTGVWVDESVAGFRIVGNRVTDSASWGIMAELSGDGLIARNYLARNSSGINLYNVSDVDVVNNLVHDVQNTGVIVRQDERKHSDRNAVGHDPRFPAGTDPRVTWYVDDINITNNVFGANRPEEWFAVQVRDTTRERNASQMGVRFTGNGFVERQGTSRPLVGWGDRNGDFTHYRTVSDWERAQGSLVNNNRVAPAGMNPDQMNAWAASNLPKVSWPSRARDHLGESGSPGFRQVG